MTHGRQNNGRQSDDFLILAPREAELTCYEPLDSPKPDTQGCVELTNQNQPFLRGNMPNPGDTNDHIVPIMNLKRFAHQPEAGFLARKSRLKWCRRHEPDAVVTNR
jgi:hypothetical protein